MSTYAGAARRHRSALNKTERLKQVTVLLRKEFPVLGKKWPSPQFYLYNFLHFKAVNVAALLPYRRLRSHLFNDSESIVVSTSSSVINKPKCFQLQSELLSFSQCFLRRYMHVSL